MKLRSPFLIFVVVFGTLTGCKTSQSHRAAAESAAMERVFGADVAAYKQTLGTLRNNNSTPAPASIVSQYTTALRNISYADVPNEFHYAYMEHIHAWESMQVVLQRKPDKGDLSMLIGLVAAVSGPVQMAVPALLGGAKTADRNSRQVDEEKRAASEQIRFSWNKIELLAVKHGTKLPQPPSE